MFCRMQVKTKICGYKLRNEAGRWVELLLDNVEWRDKSHVYTFSIFYVIVHGKKIYHS